MSPLTEEQIAVIKTIIYQEIKASWVIEATAGEHADRAIVRILIALDETK